MGAWGAGSFENDAAVEWLEALMRAPRAKGGAAHLRHAIAPLADPAMGYIELDEACSAIAAGEIVAAVLGRPAATLSEPVREWVARHGAALAELARELQPLALVALNRVKTASELHELWEEEGPAARKFQAAVDELHERLRAAA